MDAPPFEERPCLDRFANWPIVRKVVLFSASVVSKLVMAVSDFEVHDADKLTEVIRHRRPGQPLITVCNHTSTLDDPVVLTSVAPVENLDPAFCRYGWCAEEICFAHPVAARYFGLGKTLPIRRGGSLWQEGMYCASTLLKQGHWFHVFPEGRCSQSELDSIKPLRWGVGKLATRVAHLDPVIIPFAHRGMEELLPLRSYVRPGKKVTVMVGDPIPIKDLVEAYQRSVESTEDEGCWAPYACEEWLYEAITERIRQHMDALLKKTDEKHQKRLKSDG